MPTITKAWNKGTGSVTVIYGGSGNGTIVVSSPDNDVYEDRSVTLTVKTSNNSISRTITVILEAKALPQFVDLGLPSGTLWAKGNIVKGANGNYTIGNETDWGTHVSWGNIDGHNEGEGYDFSDANYSGTPGRQVSADIPSTDTQHDICAARLGTPWHLPTKENLQELYDNTDTEWVADYNGTGVAGRKFMKKTDHSVFIFIPASGYYEGTSLYYGTSGGYYWSSSYRSTNNAYYMLFSSSSVNPQNNFYKRTGRSVRPIMDCPYLKFTAVTDTTFSFTNQGTGDNVQYSINYGLTWTTLSTGNSTPTITAGNSILWKSTRVPATTTGEGNGGIGNFSSTGQFNVSGNIMSMLYGDSADGQTTISKYAFSCLFRNCTGLKDAGNLGLPATTLTQSCYSFMFKGCTRLTAAPVLPATTLGSSCYNSMFRDCTSLTTAPSLSATTLVTYCYYRMFSGCTSLTSAPPLSASTLESYCYAYMFYGCSHLNYIRCLATSISASNCLTNWVSGVKATGTFYMSPSASWTTGASGVPTGWAKYVYPTPTFSTIKVTNVSNGSDFAVSSTSISSSRYLKTISVVDNAYPSSTVKIKVEITGTNLTSANKPSFVYEYVSEITNNLSITEYSTKTVTSTKITLYYQISGSITAKHPGTSGYLGYINLILLLKSSNSVYSKEIAEYRITINKNAAVPPAEE